MYHCLEGKGPQGGGGAGRRGGRRGALEVGVPNPEKRRPHGRGSQRVGAEAHREESPESEGGPGGKPRRPFRAAKSHTK